MATEAFRLRIEGYARGYHWANVLHFNCDNNDDTPNIQLAKELVDAMETPFADFWSDFNTTATVIQWMEARRIIPNNGNSVWKEYPDASLAGSVVEEMASVSLAPIVKLYTGLDSGRQGRIFLPPPPDSEVVNNEISVGYHNFVMAWMAEIEEFTANHDWNLAVYSRQSGQTLDVTTYSVSPILGQIGRRRKPL